MLDQKIQYYFNGSTITPLFVVNAEFFIVVQTHKFSKIVWKPICAEHDLKYYNPKVQQLLKTLYNHIKQRYNVGVSGKCKLNEPIKATNYTEIGNGLDNNVFFNELIAALLYNGKCHCNPGAVMFYDKIINLINLPTQKTIITNDLYVYSNLNLCFNDLHKDKMATVDKLLNDKVTLFAYCNNSNSMVEINKCAGYTRYTYCLTSSKNTKTKILVASENLLKFVFIRSGISFVSIYALCRNADKSVTLSKTKPNTVKVANDISSTLIDDFMDIQKNLKVTYYYNNDNDSYEKVNQVRLTINDSSSLIEVCCGKKSQVWSPINANSLIKISPKQ